MTAPVRTVAEGATYARMTVSLNGWGVAAVGGALHLECALLFEGEEGSVEAVLHTLLFLPFFLTTLLASIFQSLQVVLCKYWPRPIFQSCRYAIRL